MSWMVYVEVVWRTRLKCIGMGYMSQLTRGVMGEAYRRRSFEEKGNDMHRYILKDFRQSRGLHTRMRIRKLIVVKE